MIESPPHDTPHGLTVRLAPMYWRSAAMALGGVVLAAALAVTGRATGHLPAGTLADDVAGIVGASAIALGCLGAMSWRLRLDASGVARRRLWRWTHWPWRSFECGAMERSSDGGFFDPERRFGRRGFALAWLSRDDRRAVRARILARYAAPPPTPADALPDRLDLRVGWPRYTLDATGLTRITRRGIDHWPWAHVDAVLRSRQDARHPGFDSLRVIVDESVVLEIRHQQHDFAAIRAWSGPSAPTINAFVDAHVPDDRRVDVWADEEIHDPWLLRRRRTELQACQRGMRWSLLGCVAAVLGLPLLTGPVGTSEHATLAAVFALTVTPNLVVATWLHVQSGREIAQIDARLLKS